MPRIHFDQERIPEALASYGFTPAFVADYAALAGPDEIPARIVAVDRGSFRSLAWTGAGLEELELRLSGSFSHFAEGSGSLPAVGDWVTARAEDRTPASGPLLLTSVLPRRGSIARRAAGPRPDAQVLAANVDQAFIVGAAGHDWNPRRLERYLTLCMEGGVSPLVLITKIDLVEDPGILVAEAEGLAFGAPVIATSAVDGRGLAELGASLRPGKTAVLLGSSGVGKSTILNALSGAELAATGGVREDDQRGRHTTTRRELFRLPGGTLLIDTPGLREIQLWADGEAVDAAFEDIEALALSCRFRDCSHDSEPGCAVRAALEEGSLDRRRWASWRKLRREVAFLERREDVSLARAEAERWRAINKSMRGYTKERRSIQGSSR